MARRTTKTSGPTRRSGATGPRAAARSSARSGAREAPPREARAQAPKSRDPIDAMLELAAVSGWRRVTMSKVAAAAGLGLDDLYRRYPSKAALLRGFFQRLDVALLEAGPAAADEPPRDRLFEIIMRRLDLLASHKEGVRAVLREVWLDPLGMTCGLAPSVRRSLDWMLAAAGLESGGLAGRLRRHGLAAIYFGTLRVWLDDDSADLARTMAALDKRLTRAEGLIKRLPSRRGRIGDLAPAEA